MDEYVVSVTWYDEITTLVVDAASPDEAVEQAKAAIEKLVREKGERYRWTLAQIEEEVSTYRRRYSYKASLVSIHRTPRDVLDSWRTPTLPIGGY